MISERYKNRNPHIKLNKLQIEEIERFNLSIKNGEYSFEASCCEVCNDFNYETLSDVDRYGLYHPVVICRTCGLIKNNPRMNQESYAKFYNDNYRKIYVGKDRVTDDFFNNQLIRGKNILSSLEKYMEIGPGITVVEIGTGAGGILKPFYDKGCKVIGYDFGEEYVAYGRKEHNLDLRVGTLKDFIGKADVIIYAHVMEHILNIDEELVMCKEKMHKESLLYIDVPGVNNLAAYKYDFLKSLQNAHVFYFSRNSLKNLLNKNGFSTLSIDERVISISKIGNSADGVLLSYKSQIEKIRKSERFYKYLYYISPGFFIPILSPFLKKIGVYNHARRIKRLIFNLR